MINLNEKSKECFEVARKRFLNWQNVASPFDNLAMMKHCAGEVVEAMDALNFWQSVSNCDSCSKTFDAEQEEKKEEKAKRELLEKAKVDFSLEIADIIVSCLIMAHNNHIDIERALCECIQKNKKRAYPEEEK